MRKLVSLFSICTLSLAAACGGSQGPEPTTAPATAVAPEPTEAPAAVKPVPDGYHTITAGLVVGDIDAAVDFYVKAFGATKLFTMPGADGKSVHGEVQIGDTRIMLSVPSAEMGLVIPTDLKGSVGSLHHYVADVDATVAQAVAAGAKAMMPVTDQFWGDRWGLVVDPWGHQWGIGTAKVVLTDEQMKQGMMAFMSQAPDAAEQVKKIWAAGTPAASYRHEGYFDVTPSLNLANANKMIEGYVKAGAKEIERMEGPGGKVFHAAVKFGDTTFMMSDAMAEMGTAAPSAAGGTSMYLYIYTENAEALYEGSVADGAKVIMPMAEMFWGDKVGTLKDASGHVWSIAIHVKDLTPEQMQAGMEAQMKQGGGHTPEK